jgi:hypothetical protein
MEDNRSRFPAALAILCNYSVILRIPESQKSGLVRLARGQDFRLFLLWLFDFLLLTVIAFTHNKLPVWWLNRG